jgi:predicted component of type VI protein secretion system
MKATRISLALALLVLAAACSSASITRPDSIDIRMNAADSATVNADSAVLGSGAGS